MRSQSGFSLLELAIVLFVLALMLGGLLMPLASRLEAEERKQTEDLMMEVREVLYGFALKNGRLPCPDCRDNTGGCAAATADDGVEDRIGAVGSQTCATEVGNIPWADLAVQRTDAWGRNFTYRVRDDFADDPALGTPTGESCTANPGTSFTLCSDGDIDVVDTAGTTNYVARFVPAIIVSYGRNALQTPSANELENSDNDTTFVDRGFSQQAGAEFDDLLIWISPHVLRNRMLQAGLLP